MKIRFCIAWLLSLWATIAWAADIHFNASVSKNTVAVGEPFEVSFTVDGNVDDFNPPGFGDFQVLSGPNQSSSMTTINGSTSMRISLSYDLAATKEGTFTIGAAEVSADGKRYLSNPVTIKVQGKAAAQGQGAAPAQQDDLAPGNSKDIANRLFIRAVPNKTTVYQGEQLTVAYKLYTSVDVLDLALNKLPDFNGFWSQEIKEDSRYLQSTQETINGSRYNVVTIKQMVLFPERTGKLNLDPLDMTFLVRESVPTNDPIEQFFGGSVKHVKYKIKSPVVGIQVKPLPEIGKPRGFQGAVGDFSVQANVDQTSLKANDALNYNLKVSGTGNFKLLYTPKPEVPPAIERYDPKITDHIQETPGGVSGSREYSYVMIPRHEGEYKLPPLTFSYFNPAKQRYITLQTAAFTLNVAKGAPGSQVRAVPGNQQEVQLLDKDIRYIKEDAQLSSADATFYGRWPFWLLLCSGPFFFVLAWLLRNRYREMHKDVIRVKGKKANKVASKHLALAAKQLANGDKKLFYEAVYRGLYGYLGDKFNIAVADLNQENIREQLQLRQLPDTLINQVLETIDLCEMARYAPISGMSDQELLEKSKNAIHAIEDVSV